MQSLKTMMEENDELIKQVIEQGKMTQEDVNKLRKEALHAFKTPWDGKPKEKEIVVRTRTEFIKEMLTFKLNE